MTIADLEPLSDAVLIEAVRSGRTSAEGELFARHHDAAMRYARRLAGASDADDLVSDAFVRVIELIRGGRGPEVAFRPYLMTAVRNRYVDHVRKDSRHVWVGEEAVMDAVSGGHDQGGLRDESEVIASAFHSLPERWQMVLWHSLVEKDPLSVTARLLGMTPNAAAALTYRAKEGLREAYLARHLPPSTDDECKPTRGLMPGYHQKNLTARQRVRVDRHLDGCPACAEAYGELAGLDSRLASNLAGAVLVIGVPTGSAVGGGWVAALLGGGRRSAARAAAAGAAAMAVVVGAILWAGADESPPRAASPTEVSSSPAAPATDAVPVDPVDPVREEAAGPAVTTTEPPSLVRPVQRPAPRESTTPTRPAIRPTVEAPGQAIPSPSATPATPAPAGVDLAIRALTAAGDGPGRFVIDADIVAPSSSPTATFVVKDLSSFAVDGGGATPRCTASAPDEAWTTITCRYAGAVDGRTRLAVDVTGRTLEARVRVDDPGADDPRPSNNAARVTVS